MHNYSKHTISMCNHSIKPKLHFPWITIYLNLGLTGTEDWPIESLEAWESETFALGEDSEGGGEMVVVRIATVTGLVVACGISISSSAQQNANTVRYILLQCASSSYLIRCCYRLKQLASKIGTALPKFSGEFDLKNIHLIRRISRKPNQKAKNYHFAKKRGVQWQAREFGVWVAN